MSLVYKKIRTKFTEFLNTFPSDFEDFVSHLFSSLMSQNSPCQNCLCNLRENVYI